MFSDPIADLLTRLRNALMVRHRYVVVPYSKLKLAILKKFKEKKLIKRIRIEDDKKKTIIVELNYRDDQMPVEAIIRVSKPSKRVYVKWTDLKPVRQGFGFRLVSTSRGIMFENEARRRRLGGEVICEVR
jgi:small subunit ribosomal protein S8